ncbi:MAG: BON domain-containing protein [Paralcaligenes sp.]
MPTFTRHTRLLMLASLTAVSLCTLPGCGVLFVGGAATTAAVASDRRTTGQQVEDKAIELKSANQMHELVGDKGRINSSCYGGLLLLTGDVSTEALKQQATEVAGRIEKVKKVVNELRVGDITPLSVRTNDTWITSKVTASLIDTKGVPTRTITITTERGVVYLLGKVTQDEGDRAALVASGVSGVNKVVKLFEIVSPESLQQRQSPAPVQDNSAAPSTAAPSTTAAPDATTSGGAQAMPIK